MKTEMTIAKRFMIASGISIALILALTATAFFASRTNDQGIVALADNSIPSVYAALSIATDINRLRGDYLKHMLTNEAADMDKIEAEMREHTQRLEDDLALYKKTMDDNDEDRANVANTASALLAFQAAWQEVYPLSRAGKSEEAFALWNSKVVGKFDAMGVVTEKTVQYDRREATRSSTAAKSASAHALWVSMAIGLAAICIGITIAWFMIQSTNKVLRETSGDLAQGAEQVAIAADQVSSSNQNLAQGASSQAASIEETSAAALEVNSMAQRNTENSKTTAEIFAKSTQGFDRTNRLLNDLLTAMDGIDISSQKISKIIKVIDEIAFQTNILALNAAVEAARAGEAGMGFAVVADEVRNLAQRSAQAAKDTAVLIEDSIHQSGDGKQKVDQVAEAIRTITADTSKMKTLVDEIYVGSVEQARGIDQISGSITKMEQVTQSAAATAEENAAATEELSSQAKAMQDVVERLISLVEGGVAQSRQISRSSGTRKRSKASFGKLTPVPANGMF